MLAGHYAPALAAYRAVAGRKGPPLWVLLLAAQAVDVGFMLLGLFGVEAARLAPTAPKLVVTAGVWTHSLPATVAWSLALGLAAGRVWRGAALPVGLVVASHFGTDLLVHTPDLPVGFTQEPALGLSLWLHPPWAWALECALVLAATLWLVPALRARAARRAWLLCAALVTLQTLSEFVIPTPPSFGELAASALALYAAVAAGGWWVTRPAATGQSQGPGPSTRR